MSYRLPDYLPELREPSALMFDTARPSRIVVDNGTIVRINIPCVYGRRFTRRDRMIWDHMTWPYPGHADGSDYSNVIAIRDVDIESEGYTNVAVALSSDAPEGLSITGEIDYNQVMLTISAMCRSVNETDATASFAVYLAGSNPEVGQLRDLITNGTICVRASLVGSVSPGPTPPSTCDLRYIPNGADNPTVRTQTVPYGEPTRLIWNVFYRDGYVFTNWNTKADGTGTDYSDGQSITPTSDMTFYAQWSGSGPTPDPDPEPEQYTITYSPNGGYGGLRYQYIDQGESGTVYENTFTHPSDFTFTKWNTVRNGSGVDYAEGDTITPSSNMTLWAQWDGGEIDPSTDTWAVTYYSNAGDAASYIQYVAKGGQGIIKTVAETGFSKSGYTFRYWVTNLGQSPTIYQENQLFMPTNDMVLFAYWEPNQYNTITFHPNGGYGTMNPQYVPRGTYTFLNQNRFAKTGSTFVGWNTNQMGYGTAYTNGAQVYLTNDITLYAQWT